MNDSNIDWRITGTKVVEILDKVNETRRRMLPRILLPACIIGFSVLPVLMSVFPDIVDNLVFWAIAMEAVAVIIVLIIFKYRMSKSYKSVAVPEIIKAIYGDLSYNSRGGLNAETLAASLAFARYPVAKVTHEDCISGTTDFCRYKFCELSYDYSNDESHEDDVCLFRGLAFDIDFSYRVCWNAHLVVIVEPRGHFLPYSMKMFKSEDSNFDHSFVSYCDDASRGREILSPQVRNSLVGLYDKLEFAISARHNKMMFCFYNNHLLILLPTSKDRFEPTLLSDITTDVIKEDFCVFDLLRNYAINVKSNLGL